MSPSDDELRRAWVLHRSMDGVIGGAMASLLVLLPIYWLSKLLGSGGLGGTLQSLVVCVFMVGGYIRTRRRSIKELSEGSSE